MTVHELYRFFLTFGHINFILIITLIGILLTNKKFFYQAACLTAFSIILNVALKGTFKIPLSFYKPQLTYAFPSGHMQFETVYYGWLALSFHVWWLYGCAAIILLGSAVSMYHFHYHNIRDLMGGFTVGIVLIGLYHYSLNNYRNRLPWIGLMIASIMQCYIHFMYETIPTHSWTAYWTLAMLILIERMINHRKQIQTFFIKNNENK